MSAAGNTWFKDGRDDDARHSSSYTRRQLLALGSGAAFASWSGVLSAQQAGAPAPKRSGLLVRPDVDLLNTRSKIVLELDGELRLKEPDPKKPDVDRKAEVKAKSTLDFFEKVAMDEGAVVASARRYVEARAENWVSGSASSQELRPQCSETLMMPHNGVWQQYCEKEPLLLREMELLHSPVNASALELLLPKEPARPNSSWSIEPEAAKSLFNLDAVHQSTLTAKIAKVDEGVATIEIEGQLDATANSVPTKLVIKGNCRAKLASRCAMVTWLGIVIQETREISQAEPGFTLTARIRLIRTETEDSLQVSGEQLKKLTTKEDTGRWLVRLESTAGRYSMLGDRRWRTYIDSGEEAILRLIENNTVIAQCNITRLPKLDDGSQLTLEGMQSDIKVSLGDSFDEFQESSEKVTANKLRLLRSVVAGRAEDVPIQWIYSHLSDDAGRRVTMIFTMGGNVTDRFAAADDQMTTSFELLPEPQSSQAVPTPAPKNASNPTAAAKR